MVEISVGMGLIAAEGVAPPLSTQSGGKGDGMVQVGHRTQSERAADEDRRSVKDLDQADPQAGALHIVAAGRVRCPLTMYCKNF